MISEKFRDLYEHLQPFVPRNEIKQHVPVFTPGYMANLDSEGKGPKGRIRIGRKVFYTRESLVEFLQDRAVEV